MDDKTEVLDGEIELTPEMIKELSNGKEEGEEKEGEK